MNRFRNQQGFMLIECMAYIVVSAIVLGLACNAYLHCQKNSRALQRNADDVLRTLRAGEKWREDVRSATGPLRLTADGGVVIPKKEADVTYRFTDGAVMRAVSSRNGAVEMLLAGVKESVMHKDVRRHVTAWRWEVELKSAATTAKIRPLFTFEAVEKGA